MSVDPPSAVTIEVWPEGDESRIRAFENDADSVITLHGLHASTSYEWRASTEDTEVVGSFTTGSLPSDLDLAVTTSGSATLEAIAFNYSCGATEYIVALDAGGEVVWYEATTTFGDASSRIEVVNRTDEGTILGIVDHDRLVEIAPDGSIPFERSRTAGDFSRYLHHDAVRVAGRTYAVNATSMTASDGNLYVIDGVTEFDTSGTLVREWDLRDILDPAEIPSESGGGFWNDDLPGARDFAHINSLWVDEDFNWYFSSRHLDTIIKVNGDAASPDFGTADWLLVGNPSSPLASELVLSADPSATSVASFAKQHHVHVRSDGRLQIFDNRDMGAVQSRVLVVDVNEDAGTARIETAYDLNRRCPAQSSAYELEDGGLLATCAAGAAFIEFAADVPTEPRFEMEVTCRSGTHMGALYRGVPWPELVE